MVTVLDKVLKRQITVDGVDFTVAIDPEGMRVTGKGKRRSEVVLRWRELLSGEAALAVALNASLSRNRPVAPTSEPEPSPIPTKKRAPKKRVRL